MTITAYYRPKTIQEALDILSKRQAIPLGGGTSIARMKTRDIAVVDLQALGLEQIVAQGNVLKVGGTAPLNTISGYPGLSDELRIAISLEANFNLRQKATIAGCVVAGDGRSTLLTALLALDAKLTWLPGEAEQSLGEFLLTRADRRPGRIIASVSVPLNVRLRFSSVARSPADRPVICVGLAAWPSGRLRIALGGFGPCPILAMDAPDPGGAEFAVRDALTRSSDAWASAEYRQNAAAALVRRMLAEVSESSG